MPKKSPSRSGFRHLEHFLEVSLRDFRHVGGLFPSSYWGAQSVIRQMPPRPQSVVEYGAGDGTLTEYILDAIPQDSRLWGVEVNSRFVKDLQEIQDSRFKSLHENVLDRAEKLKELCPEGMDAVISGIPFSFLVPSERDYIIRQTYLGLKPGGRFIVYQYSPRLRERLAKTFGSCNLTFEPRNMFPLFVMVCIRK